MGRRRRGRKFWSMKGELNGVKFDSGFEKKFLEKCEAAGVRVARSQAQVRYMGSDNKFRTYHPDFYLLDFDWTVEIKGCWALKNNHGFVREKFFAAQRWFKGRFFLITERELRTDAVERFFEALKSGASAVSGWQDGDRV